MSNELKVKIWRRGRGVVGWDFNYVRGSPFTWFTTPGWYHFARDYVYRLTLDHDYPGKPMWLGRREGDEWVNMEGLYEPLAAIHSDYTFVSTNVARSRRSGRRIAGSERTIKRTVEAELA
jgi:hypothetical protein